MGNCAATQLHGGGGIGGLAGDEDPVAVCRDRKRLIKSAADRRFALAASHSGYVASLRAVAAALDLFVARHVSPAPILITLPSSPSPPTSPKPKPLTQSTPPPPPLREPETNMTSTSPDKEEKVSNKDESFVSGYYFSATPPPPPVMGGGITGWDFFNPFYDAEEVMVNGGHELGKITDEDIKVVREREGIPDLEEAEEEVIHFGDGVKEQEMEREKEKENERDNDVFVGVGNGGEMAGSGMEVVMNGSNGRELLAALKEVEELFVRSFEAGKEVSRMLEANPVLVQSGLDEIRGEIFLL